MSFPVLSESLGHPQPFGTEVVPTQARRTSLNTRKHHHEPPWTLQHSTARLQMDHLPSSAHRQRQDRISFLQQTLSSYGSDIMARITRSSKHKVTPASTPTKPAPADADMPIESIEAPTRNKESKEPCQRKPRKKRQRDANYKLKRRGRRQTQQNKAGLATLNLAAPEREKGNKTSQKLADIVLEQRAEIDRLRKQLHGDTKSSEDSAAAASPNDSAPSGLQRRQRKTIA